MKAITEGTISYLIGCHQFFLHPIWVLMAWRLEYKSWPRWWEVVCIFLHDIGHIGKQYLSDPKQKGEHWKLGAKIANRLFGGKGFLMVAGHVMHSRYPRSKLFIPDKRSWLVAPMWHLWCSYWIEGFKAHNSWPSKWKKIVAKNLKNGCPKDSHELYLENKLNNESIKSKKQEYNINQTMPYNHLTNEVLQKQEELKKLTKIWENTDPLDKEIEESIQKGE